MGKDKTTTTTEQTTQRQLSPEEKRLMELEVQAREQLSPLQTQVQEQGLNLVSQLLTGKAPLPGFFQKLSEGISPEVVTDIVNQSLSDIAPRFQSSGILDSGVAASISARTAGDIRRASAEYNLNNQYNLLNLALSGQAQVQQPVLASQAALNSQLASSSAVRTTGSTAQYAMNPFLSSFQTSAGSSLGKGLVGGTFGMFSGGGGFGAGAGNALGGGIR